MKLSIWLGSALFVLALASCADEDPVDPIADAGSGIDVIYSPDANTDSGVVAMDAAPGQDAAALDAQVQDAAPDCTGTQTSDPVMAQLMEDFRAFNAERTVPGGALAVVQVGRPPFIGVIGSKSPDRCDPITEDTLFRTGLLTQAVTAIAAMDAVEDGRFDLDEPVRTYVPDLALTSTAAAATLTARHLLYMSSGLGEAPTACPGFEWFTAGPNRVIWSPPGRVYRFNVADPALAGLALVRATSAASFASMMSMRVLEPLGMGGTFVAAEAATRDHTPGYRLAGVGNLLTSQRIDAIDCEVNQPSHQYFGSVHDMVKLLDLFLGQANQVLTSSRSVSTMLEADGPFFPADGASALGLRILHLNDGSPLYFQDGYSAAHAETFYFVPSAGFGMVVMNNAEHGEPWAFGDEKLPSLIPGGLFFPVPAYQPTLAELESLVGTYNDPIGLPTTGPRSMTVRVSADGLTLDADLTIMGTTTSVRLPLDGHRDIFHLPTGPDRVDWIRFWRDANGQGEIITGIGLESGPPLLR